MAEFIGLPRLAGLKLGRAGRLALCLLPLAAGCLDSRPRNLGQAPVIDRGDAAEKEAWRRRYQRNRPDAPSSFHVFPVPPRDNSFKEFDDLAFQGMDRQTALPDLPGASRMDGTPEYSLLMPPSPAGGNAGGGMIGPGLGQAPAIPSILPASRHASRPDSRAGITAGTHFYPIEQLVYGGDYPDIDKPELYRLMPKDVVTLAVKDHPEFSGEREIQPDGTIKVPNTSDLVRLRGLTIEEAAGAVREAVLPYVKGECLVRVQANRARGGYYFVFGEVLQPGRFPMGMEPVRLSDAVLAANWEANPARRDLDGDELGPSFPAAAPRGRYLAPPLADLARVMLITPHRSQPARSLHDMRSALLGVTSEDPLVRPGQIIFVPSLDPGRNPDLGLKENAGGTIADYGIMRSPARLPETVPPARATASDGKAVESKNADKAMAPNAKVEDNMAATFTEASQTAVAGQKNDWPPQYRTREDLRNRRQSAGSGWRMGF
ncbi:MAG: polysaccharide biosynthesis/export family protein [Planctomycetota bacterium]|jgi:hypothetical protein|nr:polysaccharide biosynthesis/export family protein [Planctomycetota bacterium]